MKKKIMAGENLVMRALRKRKKSGKAGVKVGRYDIPVAVWICRREGSGLFKWSLFNTILERGDIPEEWIPGRRWCDTPAVIYL